MRKNSLEPQIAYEDYSSKVELENIQKSDKLGLVNLTLTTSLGDAPTLEFGDKWHLKVKTDKRTWLYCYYIQVDRKFHQLVKSRHMEKLWGTTTKRPTNYYYPA